MQATLETPVVERARRIAPRMIGARDVARLAKINYNTLLYWVRWRVIRAAVHPDRQWGQVLFTVEQAQAITDKAARVRELRRQLRAETSPPGRARPTKRRPTSKPSERGYGR